MTTERQKQNNAADKKELLLMLTAPLVMAGYYYGERALRLAALAALLSLALSVVGDLLLRKTVRWFSPSALATGLMVALMLPASVSYSLLFTAVFFAFAVCRLPFGNGDKTPFVPAAGAIAFITVCREASVFTYPSLDYPLTDAADPSFVSSTSLAAALREGNSIYTGFASVLETVIGRHTGPMGATCAFVLLAVSLYLLARHRDKFLLFVGYILSAALFAALFPRVLTGSVYAAVMELCSGTLLFGGLFLLTDAYSSPKGSLRALLFGITGGVAVMLLRKFGIFEDSTCFAVLLMNALSPLFDKITFPKRRVREEALSV